MELWWSVIVACEPVVWSGELLWPQSLPLGPVLDCAQVEALGTWAYALLRSRPGIAVVGASPTLRSQFKLAKVPVMCYDRLRDVPVTRPEGVTLAERDLLWGDDSHG